MDVEAEMKQRRALADWRSNVTGKALIGAALGGGVTTAIANVAESGFLYAVAPFVALAVAGLTFVGGEPPRS